MFYPACLTYLFYVHVGCRLEFHYGEDRFICLKNNLGKTAFGIRYIGYSISQLDNLDKDNYQLISIKKKYITYCQCPSEERPQSLSKLNTNVRVKRTAITQEKMVTPLKKSAFGSSVVVQKISMSKCIRMHTHAANRNI